ncbi:uncharacterized protein TM35_000061040, partial [Trypanosoma theileri]
VIGGDAQESARDILEIDENNDSREVEIADRKLRELIARADALLLDGGSCLSVWESEVVLCDNNSLRTKEVVNLVEEVVDKAKNRNTSMEDEEFRESEELNQKTTEVLKRVENIFEVMRKSVAYTRISNELCWYSRGHLEEVMNNLGETQTPYAYILEDEKYNTTERILLDKMRNKTYNQLYNFMGNFGGLVIRTRNSLENTKEKAKHVKKVLERLIKELENIERTVIPGQESQRAKVVGRIKEVLITGKAKIEDILTSISTTRFRRTRTKQNPQFVRDINDKISKIKELELRRMSLVIMVQQRKLSQEQAKMKDDEEEGKEKMFESQEARKERDEEHMTKATQQDETKNNTETQSPVKEEHVKVDEGKRLDETPEAQSEAERKQQVKMAVEKDKKKDVMGAKTTSPNVKSKHKINKKINTALGLPSNHSVSSNPKKMTD